MYNNDENMYHHTYDKGGNEPGQRYDARPGIDEQLHQFQQQQSQPQTEPQQTGGYYQSGETATKPPKKKERFGLKLAALALACALFGGVLGGGIVWVAKGGNAAMKTEVQVSNRPATEVVVQKVDGGKELSFAELYAANVNSVVSINTTATSGYNFFGQPVQSASAGSGFVLTKDGYIVTNYHVVKDAETVKVTLYHGDTYDATYVGGDEDYDIAVIKVEAADLTPVVLGNSDHLNVGDEVLAIGNPLGELTFSMSEGIASSVNRAINVSGTPFNMIQVTCAINPGNSGGPLFNRYGEVVGIVSAKYSSYSSNSVEGLGFAIPMNDVVAMIQDIMTNGYISNKPYLGINGGTMTEQMASQYRYEVKSGVFIYSVEDNGAAQKAGLQMGDVITAIDETEITSLEDLTAVKKKYSAGDTATFTIYRGGETQKVEVTWDAVPADQQTKTEENTNRNQDQNGNGSNNGNGGYYGNPWDMFNYFFGGNRW